MRTDRLVPATLLLAAALALPPWAQGHGGHTAAAPLVEITVVGRREDLVGSVDSASTGRVGPEEVMARPLLRPGELLEHVPGVTVTQHSATGKANQYFLRGFNLDHGTDFATSVDGVPVNMPTHGHGQGYMDVNFLIPELVESMTFRKGPYHAVSGDFSSAGAVDIRIKDRLDQGIAQVETGGDGWQRYLVADSTETARGTFLYGLEANGFDGPWDVDESLERYNLYLRYSEGDEAHGYRIGFSSYGADWDSTDQIPSAWSGLERSLAWDRWTPRLAGALAVPA